MFFPGYLVSKVLFSKKELNMFERFGISLALSMVVIPIICSILYYIFKEIKLHSLSLTIYFFIIVLSIITQVRYNSNTMSQLDTGSDGINYDLKRIIILCICFVLITLAAMVVRVYPAVDYSSLGGCWIPGNHLYHTFYTLQTGKLLERGSIVTPTPFSVTIYNSLSNKGFIFLQISVFLISGFSDLTEFLLLNKFFPLGGAFLFPASALAVANRIWRSNTQNVPIYYHLLIYFVAAFASFR